MPRYHVYTKRHGHRLLGNVGHVAAVWPDLKTNAGALNRARRLASTVTERGDEIVVERELNRHYGSTEIIGRFFFHSTLAERLKKC